jgi:kynurenine formamidase
MPKQGEAEFRALLEKLTNRGRWGDADERGALNHISEAKRRAAASCVRRGRSFSLAIPMLNGAGPQQGAGSRVNPLHFMTATGCDPVARIDLGMNARFTDDFLAFTVQGGTQWDALCHIYYDDTLYNGAPASEVSSAGAARMGIDKVHSDFVSRGVLLDVARAKGVECLTPAYPITIRDLIETEERQGIALGEGDILLLRTGQMTKVKNGFRDWSSFHGREPGLHWETAEWLAERRVAAVAADNSMVEAAGVLPGIWVPFHMLALCNLGIHLGEFWYLEDLAVDCAKDRVYECLLVAQALPIEGGTGSPVNPIALK